MTNKDCKNVASLQTSWIDYYVIMEKWQQTNDLNWLTQVVLINIFSDILPLKLLHFQRWSTFYEVPFLQPSKAARFIRGKSTKSLQVNMTSLWWTVCSLTVTQQISQPRHIHRKLILFVCALLESPHNMLNSFGEVCYLLFILCCYNKHTVFEKEKRQILSLRSNRFLCFSMYASVIFLQQRCYITV